MLKSKKVAITGSIGAGKSSVCDFLEEFGSCVIRSDRIVHELLESDALVVEQIVKEFGKEIIENGQVSRKKLAERAFIDSTSLKNLEKILHPLVLHKVEQKVSKAEGLYPLIVVEIPLLYELKQEVFFDYVIVVSASESICLKRMQKKGFSTAEYQRRMVHQSSFEEKIQKAHFVIINEKSKKQLKEKTAELYKNLLAK